MEIIFIYTNILSDNLVTLVLSLVLRSDSKTTFPRFLTSVVRVFLPNPSSFFSSPPFYSYLLYKKNNLIQQELHLHMPLLLLFTH